MFDGSSNDVTRRCVYDDGDGNNLSKKQIFSLKKSIYIKHTNFNESLSSDDIGFWNDNFYLGTVSEVRVGAKNNKDRRCIYNDGDIEDLSLRHIQTLSRLYPLPRFIKKADSESHYDNTDYIPSASSVKRNKSNSSNESSLPKINDQHLYFISQNVQSLRSEAQCINLDAIIEFTTYH